MDRSIYVSMTGVKHLFDQQAASANNLANASTTGFKAQIDAFHSVGVQGDGSPTRSYVMASAIGTDLTPGPIETTGRSLDVAIDGQGFFAVQTPDGSEAYTRMGKFSLDSRGWLLGAQGHPVMGENGAIQVPAGASQVQIQPNGALHAVLPGESFSTRLDSLKRVDAPTHQLKLAGDGLLEADTVLAHQPGVGVQPGAYEGSNVSLADAMVQMIKQNRLFDLNLRLVQTAEQNAKQAGTLMSLSRV
jgi:flagellar basal-body rod protein FlgF